MSDLVKAQNLPQVNWYTCWTSLGANGMPDKQIKEGLKQPNQIKVSFKKETKEITGHVATDKAWFGAEYFLAYTLPFSSQGFLTPLSDTQKDNGPLLFSLLGQCFQEVGLTKWQVDQRHCKAMPKQCRSYKGKLWQVHQGLPWGRCWVSQHWWPADLLALYGQEACTHANTRVHLASSAASQLPWKWLPPSNYGRTHGAREEWTNLLCAV